jgi:hypothetical protein
LYEKVSDFENIYLAYCKARKGKRGRAQPAMFERVQDDELLALQEELQTQSYRPGAYHSFLIHDPKKRLISAAPFRDRVVHHADLTGFIVTPALVTFSRTLVRVGKGISETCQVLITHLTRF